MGLLDTFMSRIEKPENKTKITETIGAYKEHLESKVLNDTIDKSLKLVKEYFTSHREQISEDFSDEILDQLEKSSKVGFSLQVKNVLRIFKNIIGTEQETINTADVAKIDELEENITQVRDQLGGPMASAALLATSEKEKIILSATQKLSLDLITYKKGTDISPAKYKKYVVEKLQTFLQDIGAVEKSADPSTVTTAPVVAGGVEQNVENTDDKAVDSFIDTVKKVEGAKYVRGGETEDAIDCSGAIVYGLKNLPTGSVVDQKFDITAQGLYDKYITKIDDNQQIKKGDLLFYRNKKQTTNYKTGQVSHVMLALGPVENGKIKIFDASVGKGAQEREITIGDTSKYEFLAGRPDDIYKSISHNSQLT